MSELNCINQNCKIFCLITGGSRGFGRELAISMAYTFGAGSVIALVARSSTDLENVKSTILQINSEISVATFSVDLQKLTSEIVLDILNKLIDQRIFDQTVLINNVGSLGDVSSTVDTLSDLQKIQNYFDLNVSSVFVLTSVFLQVFKELVVKPKCCFIVNITSLAAIQPFVGWAQYCSGKAARELYFKVLAEEFQNAAVLNYSPGPMETDMTSVILQTALPQIQDWFISAKAEGRLLKCETSAKKLVSLLLRGTFKSGDRVDVYDLNSSD